MKKKVINISIFVSIIIVVLIFVAIYVHSAYPVSIPTENIRITPTSQMLKRGEYLTNNVAYCIYCHSDYDKNNFPNQIVAGTEGGGGRMFTEKEGYPGIVYSRNLTPYALGEWSDGEIIRAFTCGLSKDNTVLFPVMNYKTYSRMSHNDIYSMVAYIRSLKPVKYNVPATSLDFPANLIIRTFPANNTYHIDNIDTGNAVQNGKYLADIALCKACHTPASRGQLVKVKEFTGGRPFVVNSKTVYSVNITPAKNTALSRLSAESFVNLFKIYKTGLPASKKSNFVTIMPWIMFSGMTEKDLRSIYAYLHSVYPISVE
jgi:cytochrome c553